MSDQEKGQRLIEIVFGPCTREEADEYGVAVQESMDELFPEMAAAVVVRYSAEQEHER